jgi:hypothetical protein
LVTNRGPRDEGYTYCVACGLIEPTALVNGNVRGSHPKPFPDKRDPNCVGGRATTGLVLGTDFITDILLVSLSVQEPLTLKPEHLATKIALRTLSEALTKAACELLELEATELQAEFRPALTPAGRHGKEAEIYLYDTLPGGAGFSKRVGYLGLQVFLRALEIMMSCPAQCDRSCYRCLRSYKNKFEHELLDRFVGASLLRFLLDGTKPTLDEKRIAASTNHLAEDLERKGLDSLKLERDKRIVTVVGEIEAPILATTRTGQQFVIALHGPLTPDQPQDEGLRKLREYSTTPQVILVDELIVRLNLPRATSDLMQTLGYS